MTAKIQRKNWNTYSVTGYTHDVAQDQRSAGGVHLHQVRRSKRGWLERIQQRNGRYSATGEVHAISDLAGEEKFATALSR